MSNLEICDESSKHHLSDRSETFKLFASLFFISTSNIYTLLKSIRNQDEETCKKTVFRGRLAIVKLFEWISGRSLESRELLDQAKALSSHCISGTGHEAA